MQALIQSTLEFSRIRAEDLETLSAISLDQPLSDALWSLQSTVDKSEAQIVREPLPSVIGDSHMLSRVFQNLIQNAIKFRSKEPLTVKISAQAEDEMCVISVSDNGIGVSMEYAEAIFEPFRRLHPRGGCPGSGLGLASVKRIIELHRGRVWLESEPGQGANFFFTLPLARAAASASDTHQTADAKPDRQVASASPGPGFSPQVQQG